ncbi:MAG: hypothetical protein Q3960_00210 [Lactobacillus sp.]|nr:hypothetical protein [Lactobacillus sp.]
MTDYYKKHKKACDRLSLIAFFIVLACLINFQYIRNFAILGAHDLPFHYQRVNNLIHNIENFNFNPLINTYSFNLIGSAVASTYPNLVIYIWAILILIFQNQVLAYLLLLLLTTFVVLISTYYSFLSVFPDKKLEGILSATAFASCSMIGYYQYISGDLGAVWSIGLMPMACAGLYHLITNNKYKMLSLAMSLLVLTHILNTLIVAFTLLIILLINFKKIDSRLIKSLSKAIGITILLTSIFWIKLATIMLSTKIDTPKSLNLLWPMQVNIIWDSITSFTYRWDITLIAVLGLVIGLMLFKILPNVLRSCVLTSFIILLLSSALVPWKALEKSPLGMIQWVARILIFPELIGCIVFSFVLLQIFKNKLAKYKTWAFCVLFLAILGINFSIQTQFYDFSKDDTELNQMWTGSNPLPTRDDRRSYKLINNDQINSILWYIDATDYLPVKTLKVYNKIVYPFNMSINAKNKTAFKVDAVAKPDGSTLKFDANKNYKEVELPFVLYNKMYKVTLDGKPVKTIIGKHALLQLNNVRKGHHTVEVVYSNIKLTMIKLVSAILFVIGLIGLIGPEWFKKIIKSKKLTK